MKKIKVTNSDKSFNFYKNTKYGIEQTRTTVNTRGGIKSQRTSKHPQLTDHNRHDLARYIDQVNGVIGS